MHIDFEAYSVHAIIPVLWGKLKHKCKNKISYSKERKSFKAKS